MTFEYDIENIFTYHPPKDEQIPKYDHLRRRAKDLAQYVLDACPESPERTIALRKLEESVMMANASIARHT